MAGAKTFWMVKPQPQIWVPDPQKIVRGANELYNVSSDFLDQIPPDPEPKASRC